MLKKGKPNKLFRKRLVAVFVMMPVLVFIIMRVWQGFGPMKSYFSQVFQIILYKRSESYEERQYQTMGLRYLYPKKMSDVTPEHSVICFWERNSEVDPGVDAYFLYPRIARTIDINKSPVDQIRTLDCDYLVLNRDHPDFDIRVKKIFIFGQNLEDTPEVLTPGKFVHNDSIYKDKTGLLEL